MNLILNEREYAADLLAGGVFQGKQYDDLACLARYYYHAERRKKGEVRKLLQDFLCRADPEYNVSVWDRALDRMVRSVDKYKLIEMNEIPVTYKEMKRVKALDSVQLERLLFTLICLAKYGNYVSGRDTGWVNRKSAEIFRLANLTATNEAKGKLLYRLREMGYIGFGRRVDNANVQVLCLDAEGKVCMSVSDMRNLGNQYMMFLGRQYFVCENCGLVVARRSNRQKYCKKCADELDLSQAIARKHKKTEKSQLTA